MVTTSRNHSKLHDPLIIRTTAALTADNQNFSDTFDMFPIMGLLVNFTLGTLTNAIIRPEVLGSSGIWFPWMGIEGSTIQQTMTTDLVAAVAWGPSVNQNAGTPASLFAGLTGRFRITATGTPGGDLLLEVCMGNV